MSTFIFRTLFLLLLCIAHGSSRGSGVPSLALSKSLHLLENTGTVNINDYETNPFDMSTYVNPNDTYVPSEEVEQASEISSGDFSNSRDYVIEGAWTPILLFCIGFVALVIVNGCLCCGAAKLCTGGAKDDEHNLSSAEHCASITFAACFLACLLAAHILYAGYSGVGDGLATMRTSTEAIGSGFDDMNVEARSLSTHADLLVPLCSSYGCGSVAELLKAGVGYMLDDLDGVPGNIHDLNVALDDAEQVVTLLTFIMYCLLVVSLAVYLVTQLCCKARPAGATCCGNVAFVTVALLGVLWMVITSTVADYCYDNPTVNSLQAMSAGKDQMYLIWYSSCHSGENPVFRYVNASTTANEAIMAAVGSNSSAAAQDIREQTEYVASGLLRFAEASRQSCSVVQAGWLRLVNHGACDSFFHGVRVIWICQVTACTSLFLLVVAGAIIGRGAREHERAVQPWRGGGGHREGRYRAGEAEDLEFEEEGGEGGEGEDGGQLQEPRGEEEEGVALSSQQHRQQKQKHKQPESQSQSQSQEDQRRMARDFEH